MKYYEIPIDKCNVILPSNLLCIWIKERIRDNIYPDITNHLECNSNNSIVHQLIQDEKIDNSAIQLLTINISFYIPYGYKKGLVERALNLALSGCLTAITILIKQNERNQAIQIHLNELIEDKILSIDEELYMKMEPLLKPMIKNIWLIQKQINELRYLPGSLEAQMAAERFSASLPTSF